MTDEHCEIVNLRAAGIGKTPEFKIEKKRIVKENAGVFFRKEVYFNGESQKFYIYRRSELLPGHRLKNPCIIASDDSTVIVPGTFAAAVDEYANIILTTKSDRKLR
jgi:N-methylhydantoinase A/oxoprolinase/acetone carboxylase beta subunit